MSSDRVETNEEVVQSLREAIFEIARRPSDFHVVMLLATDARGVIQYLRSMEGAGPRELYEFAGRLQAMATGIADMAARLDGTATQILSRDVPPSDPTAS